MGREFIKNGIYESLTGDGRDVHGNGNEKDISIGMRMEMVSVGVKIYGSHNSH